MLKIGDFSKLSRVSIRMLRYYDDIGLLKPAETNPYTATVYDGPMFNIYHVSPHETSDPNEFVTEVCYPVKKK